MHCVIVVSMFDTHVLHDFHPKTMHEMFSRDIAENCWCRIQTFDEACKELELVRSCNSNFD